MITAFVKAFIPIEIADARFISSTILEPVAGEPAFNIGSTYSEFDQVSVVATNSHLLYESLIGTNTGNAPATSPAAWILKSYTTRFRMFEYNNGLPSTGASPLTTVIRPGMGEVDWGTVREDENYSSITYESGFAKFDPVPSIPVLELPIEIDAIRVNRARQFKEQANGKAVVWSAMNDIDTLREMHVLIGPYQRFRFPTLSHRLAKIDLTIKGI